MSVVLKVVLVTVEVVVAVVVDSVVAIVVVDCPVLAGAGVVSSPQLEPSAATSWP